MSEPKLISPLLDRFVMGQPISDHHGVRCCPAMTKNGDGRYIVKIISIPASQVQLEALLLAGAYKSQMAALAYFHELATGLADEVEVLKKLSRFDGFVPYDNLQIVEMDDGKLGYDVYLLSPYKRSLERHLKKNPMTHLKAVNLGLDLCAAMVMCRRAGYLYVDLKPGNIFINEKNEYCVGDLGFVRLDSLKYASLPDKYRSPYTAPELNDVLASLNGTVDTYAIGMILYQIYNGGKLPESGDRTAPEYADSEIAEIILKAIDPDPEQRWEDPVQMGQALVAYMQRNSVNDVPIIPIPEPPAPEPPAEAPVSEPTNEESVPETEESTPEAEAPVPTPEEPVPDAEASVPLMEDDSQAPAEEIPESTADAPVEQDGEADAPIPVEPTDDVESDAPEATAPEAEVIENADYADLSEETSDILAQADELLAMEIPEPVVAPEPIDVPIPEPIVLTEDTVEPEEEASPAPAESEPEAEASVPQVASQEAETEPSIVQQPVAPEPNTPEHEDEEETPPPPKKKRKIGGIIALILILALLAGGAAYGLHYYNNIYLQTISDLEIQGQEDRMTVTLTTDIADNLLNIVCSDSYGNNIPGTLNNGVAEFTGLNPDTIYKVSVSIDGFHELRGETTGTYTTPAQTNIIRFEATAGADQGSVILTFTVEGKDTNNWTIHYSTEGETERSETFSGHILTVKDLTPGKEYTFRLSSTDSLYMTGTDTVSFTISAPVYAQDLVITECTVNGLVAQWAAPEDAADMTWIVRCYSDAGYDETIETTDLTATFTGVDPSQAFTVEVTAKGMSTGVMSHISGRSSTILSSAADTSKPLTLKASWEFEGEAPVGGWLVTYQVSGSEKSETVLVTEPSISIYPAMPGDEYIFTINAADGTTVFDNTFTCTAGSVMVFQGYGVTADNMSFRMCRTPSYSNWSWEDLSSSSYTSSFAPGEKASFVVNLNTTYNTSDDYIDILFVVRNENMDIVCMSSTGSSWTYLWSGRYCELDIPTLPTESGKYTIDIYFNGMAAARDYFTIE